MSEDKMVNGYYQTNITTSRGENITYTTEYAIDKLQQENKQLKEVIEEVREVINGYMPNEHAMCKVLDEIEFILDKAKD